MRKIVSEIFFGNDAKMSAVIAFTVIALIGLGCFCKKDGFDFSNIGKPNTVNRTNSTYAGNSADTPPYSNTDKTFTKADASKGETPSVEEMNQIVEQALLDFNQAIQDEDFTNFRSKVSKPFQDQYSADAFKQGFMTFINQKQAMNRVLTSIKDMEPEYTNGPEVVRESGTKVLKAQGSYQTYPGLKFDMSFIPEKTEWKLLKIEVKVGIE